MRSSSEPSGSYGSTGRTRQQEGAIPCRRKKKNLDVCKTVCYSVLPKWRRVAHERDQEREERICFGLIWFDDEAEAVEVGRSNRESKKPRRVNGGMLDGMICDRAPEFDYTDETGRKLYAVRS